MADKNKYYQDLFQLSDDENVVQDYSCGMKGQIGRGKLYISQNFVCYYKGFPKAVFVGLRVNV